MQIKPNICNSTYQKITEMVTMLGIPIVLIVMYGIIALRQLRSKRKGDININIFYVCMMLAWFLGMYFPLMHHQQDDNQKMFFEVYYALYPLLGSILPDFMVIQHFLQIFYSVAALRNELTIRRIATASMAFYFLFMFIFNFRCVFGITDNGYLSGAWMAGIILSAIPIIFSAIILFLTIRIIKKQIDETFIFDTQNFLIMENAKKMHLQIWLRLTPLILQFIVDSLYMVWDGECWLDLVDCIGELVFLGISGGVFLVRVEI